MGDILTPKRQTVVDRLRRRIEFYRGHQDSCYPRYENTCGGFYDQQRQETQILRQRYLESKAKKSKKDHRSVKDSSLTSDSQRNLMGQQKFSKRTLEASNATLDVPNGPNDEHEHKPKIIRTCKTPDQSGPGEKVTPKEYPQQQQQQQTSIPSFSGQMLMQQFPSMTPPVQHSGKDLSTPNADDSVSKAGNNDGLSVGSICLPTKGPDVLPANTLENIVCKQEREPDLNQCSNAISSGTVSTVTTDVTCSTLSGGTAGSCERFSDALSNLGFPDDSTDDMINVDLLNEFLNGVDVSPEFIKNFSFDDSVTSDKDDKETASIIENECRKPADGVQQTFSSASSSLHSTYLGLSLSPPPHNPVVFEPSLSAPNVNNNIPTSASNACFDQSQIGNFGPSSNMGMGQNVGFDFKLKDPSPAAQTLKQLAEQHQSMQQKQQMQLAASPHSQSHFGVEAFGSGLSSLHSSFLSGSTSSLANPNSSNLCQKNPSGDLFSADVFKQSGFESLAQGDLLKQENIGSSFLGGGAVGGIAPQQSDLNVRQELSTHLQARRGGRNQAATSKSLYGVEMDQKPCIANAPNYRASRSSPHLLEQSAVSHTTIATTHVSNTLLPNHFMGTQGTSIRTSSPQYQGVKQSAPGHVLHVDNNHQLQMGGSKHKVQSTQGKSLDIVALKQVANNLPQNPIFRGYNCNPNSNVADFQVTSTQSQSVAFQTQYSNSSATTALLPGNESLDAAHQVPKHRMNPSQQSGMNLPSQQNDEMFFLSCPPPEYKPQMPSVSQVPNPNNMGNANNLLPLVLNSNQQPFHMQGGLSRTYSENAANQSSSHQLSNKQIATSLSQPNHHHHHLTSGNLNQANMTSTLPTYSQASQMNIMSSGSQVMGTVGQPSTAANKPLYTNALSHDQRAPPNVNTGPEGLNITQHGPMMGLEWKHGSLVQQNIRHCNPMQNAQQKMQQARFSRGLQHANFAPTSLPPGNQGTRQVAPRNFMAQQQQSAASSGHDAVNPSSAHIPTGMIPQQQQHQMAVRNSANAQGQTMSMQMQQRGGNPMLDHNMYHQNNPSAIGSLNTNTMQENANISLDYLNSIDGNAGLMNFDQVMQSNGAFTLLDEIGVLGK